MSKAMIKGERIAHYILLFSAFQWWWCSCYDGDDDDDDHDHGDDKNNWYLIEYIYM